MTMRRALARFGRVVFATTCALTACDASYDGSATAPGGNSPTTGFPPGATADGAASGGDDASFIAPDAGSGDAIADAGGDAGVAQRLIALTSHCNVASFGKFKTGGSTTPTVDICRLNGAFFWNAGMDIDCDGQPTAECNSSTDPSFDSQTSFTQSDGSALISAKLSYYVIPLPSFRFSYRNSGIHPGAVGIVIVNGNLRYGVFGDEGAADEIGGASYAMAKGLGVDPSPTTGGVSSGVTYIVFTGSGAVCNPIESHNAAVTLGEALTTTLLANN
jgi:hypothetical protein